MLGIWRREFITLFGATAAWPIAARAQQAVPIIGFVTGGSAAALRRQIEAFREGLKQPGWIEGQTVNVEYGYADGQLERFPALVSDLVRRRVSMLVVTTLAGAVAAKGATTTIPIVFSVGDDPVTTGLVESLNRPGGNLTGVYQFAAGIEAKRLGLLHELAPKATTLAALVHPNYTGAEAQIRDLEEAAMRLGVQLLILRANGESDFEGAFATIAEQGAAALLVCASPLFNTRRQQLIVLAARHGLPAIYEWRDFAEAGGLMSYGTVLSDAYRQAGIYAGRILKGEKPADLPVVQSTRFEFVINLSTAKALGIEVPPILSARADEIIE